MAGTVLHTLFVPSRVPVDSSSNSSHTRVSDCGLAAGLAASTGTAGWVAQAAIMLLNASMAKHLFIGHSSFQIRGVVEQRRMNPAMPISTNGLQGRANDRAPLGRIPPRCGPGARNIGVKGAF